MAGCDIARRGGHPRAEACCASQRDELQTPRHCSFGTCSLSHRCLYRRPRWKKSLRTPGATGRAGAPTSDRGAPGPGTRDATRAQGLAAGRAAGLATFFRGIGDFWRLSSCLATFGGGVAQWREKVAKTGCARGRAPERAGGGAERPRMVQIGAQLCGSGPPCAPSAARVAASRRWRMASAASSRASRAAS
jgi:hypothetical protein